MELLEEILTKENLKKSKNVLTFNKNWYMLIKIFIKKGVFYEKEN